MFLLWLRPICRGLLSQCTRACKNSTSNPSGYALGIWLPVSHAPSCIGTTNPSRTGLNPLIVHSRLGCCMTNMIWLQCTSAHGGHDGVVDGMSYFSKHEQQFYVKPDRCTCFIKMYSARSSPWCTAKSHYNAVQYKTMLHEVQLSQ